MKLRAIKQGGISLSFYLQLILFTVKLLWQYIFKFKFILCFHIIYQHLKYDFLTQVESSNSVNKSC